MKKSLQEAIHRAIALGSLSVDQIPVELLPENQPLGYQSPIALKLSTYSDRPPLDRAQQWLDLLSLQENLSGFSLSLRSPGWIQFHYRDLSLTEQLQTLLASPLKLPHHPCSLDRHSPEVFTWQATHARCCALLRLGQNQGLIRLESSTFEILEPDPIPWLGGDRHFCLSHPSEHTLIRSLLYIWDSLNDDPTPSRFLSLTRTLSQEILRFDQNCRIWGSTLKENPSLALSRLALVSLSQKTLKSLLEQGLSLTAPPEL
ncbi:DALR anticodon-binding domain-containing protein [Roseofilum sp. BLCC_M154]|uniref:DALR anticodon-binding domain-containing protein n=1 Tax=Roseofilum acuticapitatum BLCC-M154 TaxID=3022444 RepID=A0ABT7AMH3_9CYAN|nr:DALR anticodon-binding domain-containing protein [Roseofilum acuticapitatum]MDJ1168089.1 DALR anticodon-binding domain-containing protein [Roseofilum acuticapitatum BLCC-M154]